MPFPTNPITGSTGGPGKPPPPPPNCEHPSCCPDTGDCCTPTNPDCPCPEPAADGGDMSDTCCPKEKPFDSDEPVGYGTGQIVMTVVDLPSRGYGLPWGHVRSYSNQLQVDGTTTSVDYGNGYNWMLRQTAYLLNPNGDESEIGVVISPRHAYTFTLVGGDYVGAFGALQTLVHDATNQVFRFIQTDGTVWEFHDFDQTANPQGLLAGVVTRGDQSLTLLYPDAVSQVSEVQRSFTDPDGVTTVESFLYAYVAEPDENAGHIESVTLRRNIDDAGWNYVRRAVFSYYRSDSAGGDMGDLESSVHQLPAGLDAWAEIGTYYYRYYRDSAGGVGFAHGLKFVLEPAAFQRLSAAVGDPRLAADAQVAQYADYYFEYDEEQRVSLETVAGGTRTYHFEYTDSGNAIGYNSWQRKTVETLPDGNRNIVYTNHISQVMLKELQSESDSWIEYRQYDETLGSEILYANPSAVQGYDDTQADLGGPSTIVKASDGLVELTEYYTSTTATPTTAGGVTGYRRYDKISQGLTGSPITLSERTYFQRNSTDDDPSAAPVTIYPVATVTKYQSDASGGSDPSTTAYEYTWHVGTVQVLQRTTQLPTVPTDQNGSGADTFQRMLYDDYGKLIWEQGPKGFIDHFAYDIVTGATTQYIRDVDPAELTIPSGWTRPSGLPAPLQLVTDYESDDRGRRTQTLGPVHDVNGRNVRTADWIVYLDARFERRSARGYAVVRGASYDYVLVNPVSITRSNAGGDPLDEIRAARGCACGSPVDAPTESSGQLTEMECFPQSAWTAWTHHELDHAGRRIATRAYHTIPLCGAGEKGSHYDETLFGYDVMGRRNRVVSPGGTITRNVFDPRNRNTATWVGTSDAGATDQDPGGGTYPPTPLITPFDPQSIPDLEFWGSGDAGLYQDTAGTTPATESGDRVARWDDRRTGSSLRFTQSDNAKRASIAASYINGRRAVRISQASGQQYLTMASNLFSIDATTPVTLFVILRTINSGAGYERLLTTIDNTGDYGLGLQRSGSQGTDLLATFSQQSFVVGLWAFDDTTSGVSSIRNVACVWSAASVLSFYRNNSLKDQATITAPGILGAAANSNGWALGCEVRNGGTSDWCNAEVAEFLIFSRVLTSGELSALFTWAAAPPAPTIYVPRLANNMVPISARTFASSCGCNEPSTITQFVDDDPANDRVTTFTLDFRNRVTDVAGEENFYERRIYDNLNRVVQVDRFDGPPNDPTTPTNFTASGKTYFDDRGNVYKRERYGISSGTVQTNKLTENNWYDEAGNLVKQSPMGAQEGRAFTKFAYDGDARQTANYKGYYTGTMPESYADALTITSSNKIFEQMFSTFDDAGNPIASAFYQRFHDATGSGVLNLPDGSQPKARVSYSSTWFDGIGRAVANANYGTNGNVAWTRPESAPERSDDVLVTTFGYDSAGNQFQSIDPAGRQQRKAFNALGVVVFTVSNYVDVSHVTDTAACEVQAACSDVPAARWTQCLTPGDTENVTVGYAYNADGNLVGLTAYNRSTGDQVTRHEYGVTLAEGPIASNVLLRSTIYPDAVDSGDRVTSTFNRQGQETTRTDQNGTRHVYEYDGLGRPTADRINEFGAGIASEIVQIATTYNSHGLVASVTSLDDSDAIVNQVAQTYNAFDQLVTESQSHSGAVVGGTPKVEYSFADASSTSNTTRPLTMTYPDGRVITYSYGTSGGDNDRLSRITSIADVSAQRVVYNYLGLGTFVRADYPEPDVRWDLITGSGANPYAGLDRFGRVIDCLWHYYGGVPADRERVQYGYDRASNRIWRKNAVASSGNDELYAYDALQRLVDMGRGDLVDNNSSLDDTSFGQSWQLDATGNWSGLRQLDTATPANNLDQQRSANQANEITGITRRYGKEWPTPGYDRTGNTTSFPQLADPTSSYEATYDAWNRIVLLTDDETVVAIYGYDGINRRVTVDDGASQRHSYYSDGWRLLEERLGTSPNTAQAERQFLWGLRYVDDLILRDRSPTNNGTLSEWLYALQDANWNVTGLVDGGGDVVERYRYEAYGNPTVLDPDFVPIFDSGFDWEIRYCGYRFDSDSGLYYVRNRYLAPILGAWASCDPNRDASYPNYRNYASSNPVNLTDLYGEEAMDPYGDEELDSDTCMQKKEEKKYCLWLCIEVKGPKLLCTFPSVGDVACTPCMRGILGCRGTYGRMDAHGCVWKYELKDEEKRCRVCPPLGDKDPPDPKPD